MSDRIYRIDLNSQIVPTFGRIDGGNFEPCMVMFHAAERQKQRNVIGNTKNYQAAVISIAAAATINQYWTKPCK